MNGVRKNCEYNQRYLSEVEAFTWICVYSDVLKRDFCDGRCVDYQQKRKKTSIFPTKITWNVRQFRRKGFISFKWLCASFTHRVWDSEWSSLKKNLKKVVETGAKNRIFVGSPSCLAFSSWNKSASQFHWIARREASQSMVGSCICFSLFLLCYFFFS